MLEYKVKAVKELAPNAKWEFRSVNGNYEDLVWFDENITKPTEEEFNAKVSEIETNAPVNELRVVRNAKLAETDWTQSRDVTLTNDADWQTYRQALRDITDTYSDLDSVVWPTKPE